MSAARNGRSAQTYTHIMSKPELIALPEIVRIPYNYKIRILTLFQYYGDTEAKKYTQKYAFALSSVASC